MSGPDLGTIDREQDIPFDSPNAETLANDPKKSIAQPPLNVLFNPSLIIKKDIWQINISALLEMLLRLINSVGSKDLRLCGIAALTSSMVHRLKVESIFNLEKIAMQRKEAGAERPELPIAELRPLEIPFRFETTYPVSLEDLMQVLESMIEKLANPGGKKKQLDLQPIERFNFDEYFVNIEEILQKYQAMIIDIVSPDSAMLFSSLTNKMDPIEIVRCFLAMLYLATKGIIQIEQIEDNSQNGSREDIRITAKNLRG